MGGLPAPKPSGSGLLCRVLLYGLPHHGVSQQHLSAYLNEFVFRFYPPLLSDDGLRISIGYRRESDRGPTYRGLYDGTWDHGVQPNKAKPL